MSSELNHTITPLGDPSAFCRACGNFATGVTVVSVLDPTGRPHGMTVNSFASVSLDPLMFLVCIDNRSRLLPFFAKSAAMAVNVLAEEQQTLSSRFAKPADDRFGTVEWEPGKTGAPLIVGSLAMIEGRVHDVISAGDHTIVMAEVYATRYREGRPLVFFGSRYQRLGVPQT